MISIKPHILGLALFVIALPAKSSAQSLATDISQNLISITSNFAGAEILLFGTISQEGDIVIVVQGPNEQILVRQKTQIARIWVNRKTLIFSNVPAYYAVASNRSLKDIGSKELLKKYNMKADLLRFIVFNSTEVPNEELNVFREALVRNKRTQNLYFESENAVAFNGKLFRSSIRFPANAPEGNYRVATYLLREGKVIDSNETELFISKVGLERQIFDFAQEKPALYGIFAIVIAVIAGWAAAIVFRRT